MTVIKHCNCSRSKYYLYNSNHEVVEIGCGAWECPVCGQKNARKVASYISDELPNWDKVYMYTFTMRHHWFIDRDRFKELLCKSYNKTLHILRHIHFDGENYYRYNRRRKDDYTKPYKDFKYIRILERHKSGHLHVHMLCDTFFDYVLINQLFNHNVLYFAKKLGFYDYNYHQLHCVDASYFNFDRDFRWLKGSSRGTCGSGTDVQFEEVKDERSRRMVSDYLSIKKYKVVGKMLGNYLTKVRKLDFDNSKVHSYPKLNVFQHSRNIISLGLYLQRFKEDKGYDKLHWYFIKRSRGSCMFSSPVGSGDWYPPSYLVTNFFTLLPWLPRYDVANEDHSPWYLEETLLE